VCGGLWLAGVILPLLALLIPYRAGTWLSRFKRFNTYSTAFLQFKPADWTRIRIEAVVLVLFWIKLLSWGLLSWQNRTRGVVRSQTPRGASAVLESLLLRRHQNSLSGARRRWAERMQRMSLRVINAVRSGAELTGNSISEVIAKLATAPALPLLQMASFSSRPTTWLDSFHQRLGEVRPGCAHDGQFYVEDLIWPGLPHVLLPHVDHAQPVMGGSGFDSARYWLATLLLFLDSLPAG
jgi:hypothetical protein